MSETAPNHLDDEPRMEPPQALAEILRYEPEIAAWLGANEEGDDDTPRAA